GAAAGQAIPPSPAPTAPGASGAQVGRGASGTQVPVVTMEQVNHATDIARLAAEHNMTALSLRAVREALRGGPPIPTQNEGSSRIRYAGQRNLDATEAIHQQVESKVQAVEALWKRRKFPAADVYQVLAGVVMPAARPAEIFLYAQPLHNNLQQPRSVAG